MEYFEYKVMPAPRRGTRVKGAKGPTGRFANAMETTLNKLAADGWEYIRAESLPADERHGITMRKVETYQNVMIFRRLADTANAKPDVTALLEDQSETEMDLFDEINDDFAEDEDETADISTPVDNEEDDDDDIEGAKN
jgi:hypothetical protein